MNQKSFDSWPQRSPPIPHSNTHPAAVWYTENLTTKERFTTVTELFFFFLNRGASKDFSRVCTHRKVKLSYNITVNKLINYTYPLHVMYVSLCVCVWCTCVRDEGKQVPASLSLLASSNKKAVRTAPQPLLPAHRATSYLHLRSTRMTCLTTLFLPTSQLP